MIRKMEYPKMKADKWVVVFNMLLYIGCAMSVVILLIERLFDWTRPWLYHGGIWCAILAVASAVSMLIAIIVRYSQRKGFINHYERVFNEPYPQLAESRELIVNIIYNNGEGKLLSNEEAAALSEAWNDYTHQLCEILNEDEENVEKLSNLIRCAAARPKAHNATKHGPNGMAVSCMMLALIEEGYLSPEWLTDKRATMHWLSLINGTCIEEDHHFLDYFHAAIPYPRNQQKLIDEFKKQIQSVF